MRGGSPPPPPRVLHLHNFLPTSEVSLNVWRLQKHHQTGFFPRCSLNFCKPQINPTMTWWSLQTVLTCVQNMLYHGHIMKPSGHLSQQQADGGLITANMAAKQMSGVKIAPVDIFKDTCRDFECFSKRSWAHFQRCSLEVELSPSVNTNTKTAILSQVNVTECFCALTEPEHKHSVVTGTPKQA